MDDAQDGIASLTRLAREIAAAEINPDNSDAFDELLIAVEQYSEQFGEWYSAYQSNPVQAHEVEELLKLHQKIIKRVQGLQKETSTAMRNFQKKARGIMAYTDILPKKISVTKPRKG